jgi:hypothetical protein
MAAATMRTSEMATISLLRTGTPPDSDSHSDLGIICAATGA